MPAETEVTPVTGPRRVGRTVMALFAVVVMLGTGSIIGIVDGNVIDVFDPRYARWMTQFTGPNPT